MSLNYADEIMSCHKSKGMLEESMGVTIIDNNLVKFNKFTLRVSKIKASDVDINYYNAMIIKKIKKDSNFFKEIREFNQLFRFFDRLNIKRGYIKKTETPDFEFSKDGMTYGIETTRIYAGNDWVAEKIQNDIVAFKLSDKTFKEYIRNNKYAGRINEHYRSSGEVKVSAKKKEEFSKEEVVHIKNKIFEKIRKQLDDYKKFDFNYIFAEVVYSGYKEFNSYEELNMEIAYYISHLDVNFGGTEFHLVLKNGNNFVDFNLKEGTYNII